MKKRKKRLISAFAAMSACLFFIIGIVYFLSDLSPPFADYINATVAQKFRHFMASISSFIPFSLFEVFIALIPILIFIIVYLAVRAFSSGNAVRYIINLCAVILLVYSGHLLALGVGYQTTDISEKMNLKETGVDKEKLTDILLLLTDEINSLAEDMPRNEQGVFDPGYSNKELSEKLCDSFDAFSDKYSFTESFESTVKSVDIGNFMSYLGLTGIYTYYTGEANVNADYPAHVRIFTSAHEMAHQRGILRENEANFVAYIVTSTSSDDYIRYSGALSMYGYFANALYRTDKEAYYSIAITLSDYAKTDIIASNEVSAKYGDTIISDISDWINNFYLKSNGTEGVISYSRVVELVISYYQ